RVRQSQREDREPRATPGEVWAEIAATSARHGVRSTTGAMHAVFERNLALLAAIGRDVSMKCSQVGALAANRRDGVG
ncbi:MAG: ARPP-1 family domain-containing protein, partial [Solirubrobacteraceae bacterium]